MNIQRKSFQKSLDNSSEDSKVEKEARKNPKPSNNEPKKSSYSGSSISHSVATLDKKVWKKLLIEIPIFIVSDIEEARI